MSRFVESIDFKNGESFGTVKIDGEECEFYIGEVTETKVYDSSQNMTRKIRKVLIVEM